MYRFSTLVVFLLFASSIAEAQTVRPNIIIILADDLGWGDVGYHGSTIHTPNIDHLAKEGVELNRFYVAAVCSPTRAGLLTGRYPDRFGLRTTVIPPWSDFGVDTRETFLPQVLARAGYKNRAILGKWHLGHAARKYHPLNRGFTHFYGHLNGAINYFTHEREGELDWHNDFAVSHDKGYSTDLLTDEAIRNIKAYRKDSPFFLYVAYNAPHGPLQAKKKDMVPYGYDSTKPAFGNKNSAEVESREGRGNTQQQTYAAMVTNMDHNIGRILSTLKELGMEDNTLVLFHSDNGAAPGIRGSGSGELKGTKFTEWEGGVRAPAIIRWPQGFRGHRVINQVMGYVDVMPTLMEIAGIRDTPSRPLDGMSMMPVLTEKRQTVDRVLYLGSGAIVSNEWKLIVASDKNPNMRLTEDHLFNIAGDPSEKHNVAGENPEVYTGLKARLAEYDAIRSDVTVPPYGAGRAGFQAPKDWVIKE
ncbi:arylsulfatase B [Dawidia soli]|uniref:Arylsulfatase n=1 Tax=Dawidia soli TaxID=2782352 RepID=A0AAP2GJI2_9BACT|nr:arylsulfatase [Dawidia soli]MBT1688505.1 arylsulfatase [Dawidia soli]